MKRFFVFGGDIYYPCGGWRDLIGQYDTMEEVQEFLNDWYGEYKWYHVVDSTTGEKFMERR